MGHATSSESAELDCRALLDNEQWATENLAGKLARSDVLTVCNFVWENHPFDGAVSADADKLDAHFDKFMASPTLTVDTAARFAHAATVFCFEELGARPDRMYIHDADRLSATELGSVAYVATRHSSPGVRRMFGDWFERVADERLAARLRASVCRIAQAAAVSCVFLVVLGYIVLQFN